MEIVQLTRKYQLESAILRMELRSKALVSELAEAKYAHRASHVALTEYEHGSFRGFLDKLSGKREE